MVDVSLVFVLHIFRKTMAKRLIFFLRVVNARELIFEAEPLYGAQCSWQRLVECSSARVGVRACFAEASGQIVRKLRCVLRLQ